MTMPMSLMALSTSTLKTTGRSLSMENLKESQRQRLKSKRRTRRSKKETKKTLSCGKRRNQENLLGNPNGEKADLDGI